MLDYKRFTLRNMLDTVMNVATTLMGMCGDVGGVVSAAITMIYDTVMTVLDTKLGGDDFDFNSAASLIWDYLGLWLAQIG